MGSLSTAGAAHVVDDSVHIDINLGWEDKRIVGPTQLINTSPLCLFTFTYFLCTFSSFSGHRNMSELRCSLLVYCGIGGPGTEDKKAAAECLEVLMIITQDRH